MQGSGNLHHSSVTGKADRGGSAEQTPFWSWVLESCFLWFCERQPDGMCIASFYLVHSWCNVVSILYTEPTFADNKSVVTTSESDNETSGKKNPKNCCCSGVPQQMSTKSCVYHSAITDLWLQWSIYSPREGSLWLMFTVLSLSSVSLFALQGERRMFLQP